MTTHDLLFLNPSFHLGLNVTVRLGDKWLSAQPGDTVEIQDAKTREIVDFGRVVFRASVQFSDIPECWLDFEHAQSARTMSGLFAGMKAAYGEKFDKDSDVACLFFWM